MSTHELQKKVAALVVVERPLQSKRDNPGGKSAHAVVHEGCVATTADGQQYLIEKGVAPDGLPELRRIGDDKGSRIVKVDSKTVQGFRTVRSVPVRNPDATLNDLLEASGVTYNFILNNCWNSTEEMQKVVDNELHLPWQMKSGMGVGILAVVAMALFAIGRMVIGNAMRQ